LSSESETTTGESIADLEVEGAPPEGDGNSSTNCSIL
jgi:hypothetical protein